MSNKFICHYSRSIDHPKLDALLLQHIVILFLDFCFLDNGRVQYSVYMNITSIPATDNGPIHLAYNPSYSACFFSRNSIFLSQKISQQCFSAVL
jgi:hypothetical protein